jgi:Fe-Mn family superoxide dismutase
MKAMDSSFGGLEAWRNDILQLAQTRGVGWVLSTREPGSNQLTNYWIGEHQLGVPAGVQPIAVFDLWEHAYMLDFAPSARGDYLNVLFQELDWAVLESRCQD